MLTKFQRDRHQSNDWRDSIAERDKARLTLYPDLQAAKDEAHRHLAKLAHQFADTQPGPLTADDLALHRRTVAMAGCAGPCAQGRKLCPCPEACLREEPLTPSQMWIDFPPSGRIALVLVGAIVAAAGLLHFLLG